MAEPSAASVSVGDGQFLFNADFARNGSDLELTGGDGTSLTIANYFSGAERADLVADNGAVLSGDTVDILAGPLAPGQYAQATQNDAGGGTQIGQVIVATGTTSATRADGTSVQLADGSPVFSGDVVQTGAGSALAITFSDGTVFNVGEDARMVLNEFVYDPNSSVNKMLFSIVEGSFVFVAGAVAKTGEMDVNTPVAALGIRGTSPTVFASRSGVVEFSIVRDPVTEIVGTYGVFGLNGGPRLATVDDPNIKVVIAGVGAAPQIVQKTAGEVANDQILQQQLTDSFISAQPLIQELLNNIPGGRGRPDDDQQPGGGEGQQEASAPSGLLFPSSGFSGDQRIAEAFQEDILTTTASGLIGTPAGRGLATLGSSQFGGAGPSATPLLSDSGFSGAGGTPSGFDLPSDPLLPVSGSGIGLGLNMPGPATIAEDSSIVLSGLSVIDDPGSFVEVEMVAQSTLTFPAAAISAAQALGLQFLIGDGVDDDIVVFAGSLEAVNMLIAQVTYDPTPDNNGDAGFSITASNGQESAHDFLPITITPVNDAPVAGNDTAVTDEDAPLSAIAVLANDSDIDGDALTVASASAANGTVFINADGTLDYVPDADFSGTDTITYQVSDGVASDTGTVTVTVNPVNDPPIATDDTAVTDEDTTLTNIPVLANDTDIDGDALTVASASAANGTVFINADGTLDYVPDADFSGTDTITYQVSDGVASDTGTVTVTVNPVNDPPVAADDTAVTDEDTTLTNIPVLANDTDIDGDALTVASASAANGTVFINADGTLDYVPDADFSGTDTITYQVSDGVASDTGTVTVTVNPVNDPPVAADDTAVTDEDTTLTNIPVLANDSDAEGDVLTVTSASAANGTVFINADGTLDYVPDADFSGTDTITYQVSDGVASDTGTVSVTVNPVNDPPLAEPDLVTAAQSGITTGDLFADNGNGADSDADGDALRVVAVNGLPGAVNGPLTLPSGAIVTLMQDGTFIFDPQDAFFSLAEGQTANETFNYTIADPSGETSTANVTVTVIGVNDAPVVVDPSPDQSIAVNSAYTFSLATTFFDVDSGDVLSYSAQLAGGAPLPAWLSFSGTTLSGTPTNLDGGDLTIEITATDLGGLSVTDTFILSVTPNILGTPFDDISAGAVVGTAANDLIDALAGNDEVFGNAGNDVVIGGQGNDFLNGGVGDDTYQWAAGDGIDTIADESLNPGNDSIEITGGPYFDLHYTWDPSGGALNVGVTPDDTYQFATGGFVVISSFFFGFGAVDSYEADTANNAFWSADGSISRAFLTDPVTLAGNSDTGLNQGIYGEIIFGNTGNNFIDGGGGFRDVIHGLDGSDTLTGNDASLLVLDGGAGNDLLLGGTNTDELLGGDGIDRLSGGSGSDTLTGGDGVDLFVFLPGEIGVDVITDFLASEDQLDLGSLLDSSGLDPGFNDNEYVRATSDGAGNAIVTADPDGASGSAPFSTIAVLEGVSVGTVITYRYTDVDTSTITVV